MAGRLEGRRAIITGGANGIGRAIVAAFVSEGAAVAVLDLDEAGARDAAGGRGFGCDVRSKASVDDAVGRAVAALGGCDSLVNGAGLLHPMLLAEIDIDHWQLMQDVNLRGPLLVTQAALPALRAAEKASVVNLVNAVCPGIVRSALSAPFLTMPGMEETVTNSNALRHCGEPHEVAPAVVYLTSHEAAFVSGTWLMMDGGDSWY